MNLIFFTHPHFLLSQSMPRFATMLIEGMKAKGHKTEIWTPRGYLYNLPQPQPAKKWAGYADQYLLFPIQVKKKIQEAPRDALYVFTDQALGPWVPLVKDKPHVIHCHDFLAQRSALGEIPQNKTGKSGQQYQAFIRRGYRQGKHFISVSHQTREDLHRFLGNEPETSEVVYNGMNRNVPYQDSDTARKILSIKTGVDLKQGYLLHVGGNQWYKNRTGVLDIYNTWRHKVAHPLPLLMVGAAPSPELEATSMQSPFQESIHFLSGMNDSEVQSAYTGASLFLYPSFAEGFGWPIAEAMAAGCPVITTGEAPMTEVGGGAAIYIPKCPLNTEERREWVTQSARRVYEILSLPPEQKRAIVQEGFLNIQRFNTDGALNRIELIYREVANRKP